MSVFIIVLCLINLGLWFIFLAKFKDLFNTDKIIEKTRVEMDKLVKDINGNAKNNIDIIDERIRKMKSFIKECDSKLDLVETRLQLFNKQLTDSQKPVKKSSGEGKSSSEIKNSRKSGLPANESQAASRYTANKTLNSDSAFAITESGLKMTDTQNTLFDEPSVDVIDTRVKMNVSSDGSSYAEVPVVDPKGFQFEVMNSDYNESSTIDRTSLSPEQLKERVISLYNQGMTAEAISSKLSISPAEVQFVLDFV